LASKSSCRLFRASIVFPDFSQTQLIHAARPSPLGREHIFAETLRQRGNGVVTKKQFGH
jgi:hypothetical protein